MASIHIKEIMQYLVDKGYRDADIDSGELFVEILFSDPSKTKHAVSIGAIDAEYANQALPVDSPIANVLILFDEAGMLRSIEVG